MGYITSSLFGLLSRLAPTIPPVSSGGSGTPGADGADGEDAFVYIAYASDASGTGFTTTYDSGLDYIAIRSTTTAIASPVAGDFAGLWKKYKGEPGTNGTNGTNGIDGTFGNQYQGDYVGGNSYVVDDIVTDGGGSYLCVTNDPSSASAPSAGNINWVAIAEKGATGAAGSSGGVSGSATKTGSTYTLSSAEANKNVLFSNSTGCTITVGANASTDFDQWYLMHRGTSGQVTLSASGSTIVGPISTGAPGDTLQLVQVSASVYHSFLHPGGNINTLTTDSSPNTAADYVRTWDASASQEKKVLLSAIGGTSGALTFITSSTASSSAALTFDGCFSSTYDAYEVHLYDIAPATDAVTLLFRWRNAGVDVTGASHYTSLRYRLPVAVASGDLYANSTNGHPLPYTDHGNAAGEVTNLVVEIRPRSTVKKELVFNGSYVNSIGTQAIVDGGSYLANTTAMSGFKLLFSSGNIASGSVYVYGIAKS